MDTKKQEPETIITLTSTEELEQFLKDNPGKIVSVTIQIVKGDADAEDSEFGLLQREVAEGRAENSCGSVGLQAGLDDGDVADVFRNEFRGQEKEQQVEGAAQVIGKERHQNDLGGQDDNNGEG